MHHTLTHVVGRVTTFTLLLGVMAALWFFIPGSSAGAARVVGGAQAPSSCGWTSTPLLPTGTNATLAGLDAAGPNDVWVVGSIYGSDARDSPVFLHWDGRSWSQAPVGDIPNYLHMRPEALHAVSSNDVWAVGWYVPPGGRDTVLTMHWNGTAWTAVPSPSPPGYFIRTTAVSAVAPDDVWAVGWYLEGSRATQHAFSMHWNGSNWSLVNVPDPASGTPELLAVAAASANDVWAVGQGGTDSKPFVVHWDGTRWNIVDVGVTGGLRAIAAISATDIWAAGYAGGTTTVINESLILHWDGRTWTRTPSPNPGTGVNSFKGLAPIAANDVWAAGVYDNGTGSVARNLMAHWNGTSWTAVPTSSPVTAFVGATAGGPNDVWALGAHYKSSTRYTWTAVHYGGPCGNATGTPTATATRPGSTATPTRPAGGTATPTPTLVPFDDVSPHDYFYSAVQLLVAEGVVSGYTDAATCAPSLTPCFKPFNNVTRGQAAKIITGAFGHDDPIPPGTQTFSDVPPRNPFWLGIERAALNGIISGYSDGTFRWGNDVTRGQIAKMISIAAGYEDAVSGQTFADVPQSNPFHLFVERVRAHRLIGGYSCGGEGEPCDDIDRPYFRPYAPATRGQLARIVYLAVIDSAAVQKGKP